MRRTKQLEIDKRLFNPREDKLHVLMQLKENNYRGFRQEIKKAYRNPITKAILLSGAQPKSISELRSGKLTYYSKNLEGEIAWLAESVELCSVLINKYIPLEKAIQEQILLGSFEGAMELLKLVNNEISYSYWGLETQYYLTEQQSGTEENWKLSHEVNSNAKDNFTYFFNQEYSRKAEKSISVRDYVRLLQHDIRDISEIEKEYLHWKLAYSGYYEYTNFAPFSHLDSGSSIIDRYHSLILILNELVSSKNQNEKDLADQIIDRLFKVISDERLTRLAEIVGLIPVKISSSKYHDIIDLYTEGNYSQCIQDIPDLLQLFPSSVELWDIYAKSLVESGSLFLSIQYSEYINEIIKSLYEVYKNNDQSFEKAEELLKLSVCIPHFSFSKQLFCIVSERLGILSKNQVIGRFFCTYSSHTNPLIYQYSSTIESDEHFENRLSVLCNRFMANKTDTIDLINEKIPAIKSTLYQLRREFGIENYLQCIDLIKSLNFSDLNTTYEEEFIFIAYNSFMELERYDEAINIYISTYFRSKNLVRKINIDFFIDHLISQNYPISGCLDNSIFFTLGKVDSYYQFVALDMWLESLNIEYPSEISISDYKQSFGKLAFILYEGCKVDVLEKFYSKFESREDVVSERKRILSILIQNDVINENKYINELSSITQKEKVQQLLMEVNNGRIRLSSDMLTSDNESQFEKSFKRYQFISDFSSKNDVTAFDSKSLLRSFFNLITVNENQSFDPSFLSFKSLTNEMIDSFLFNKKSGLDGDLSTKIRHGEIENQLRSVFDGRNLISKKDSNNTYIDIAHWKQLYENRISSIKLLEIQKTLKDFSFRIDKEITFLVKEQLQVRSENYPEKENAFFDYYFQESAFKLIHNDIKQLDKSFEKFSDYLYSILKAATEANLSEVIKYLQNSFLKKFDKELDNTKSRLNKICLNNEIVELIQNINDSKVEFQNEIHSISNWFLVTDSQLDKFMDIKSLIQCSFESSNIQHPKMKLSPIINATENRYLYHYTHYIFILLILINNVRTKSKLKQEDINVSVSAVHEEQMLVLKMKNNFNEDEVNSQDLNDTLSIVKTNWIADVSLNKVNKEGGTGFEKIKKILTYDLKIPYHEFDFVIQKDSLEIIFKIGVQLYKAS